MNDSQPRVTFGMIVLNGEPFVRYNLRALYPFAYQIIVVEGAAPGAAGIATPDGHSTDATLTMIHCFQAEEDPALKVVLVTAEDEGHPDGFWPGEKDEQSQAYAKRAIGNYLWQVDSDEFYLPEDMSRVIKLLQEDPSITSVTFPMITFWGGFTYVTDGWYLRRGARFYHRLFRWEPGYRYVTHRPPTVYDEKGRDLRSLHWLTGEEMERRHIVMRHYSLLFPKQVIEKCNYYGAAGWAQRSRAAEWARTTFLQLEQPYRVHNVYDYPSWLEHFDGAHPPQIEALRRDIARGAVDVEVRRHDDIERLLRSPCYVVGRFLLRTWDRAARHWSSMLQNLGQNLHRARRLGGRVWRNRTRASSTRTTRLS